MLHFPQQTKSNLTKLIQQVRNTQSRSKLLPHNTLKTPEFLIFNPSRKLVVVIISQAPVSLNLLIPSKTPLLIGSFWGLRCRILNVNHKKDLLRSLWVKAILEEPSSNYEAGRNN